MKCWKQIDCQWTERSYEFKAIYFSANGVILFHLPTDAWKMQTNAAMHNESKWEDMKSSGYNKNIQKLQNQYYQYGFLFK